MYGFVLWLPTILRAGMREGIEAVGFLSVAPYLLAVILMLAASHYSDKSLHRKRFVWPFLIVCGAALFGSYVTSSHHFWAAYAFLIVTGGTLYAPLAPYFAIIPEMLPAHVAGEVMAVVNSAGALGGFVGAWLVGVLEAVTGNSQAGFLFMSGALLIAGVLVAILRPTAKTALAAEPDAAKDQAL